MLPAIAGSVGALYLLTRNFGEPNVVTALVGLLGVAYLPGWATTLWVEKRYGLWSSWVLPLVLSPVLTLCAGMLLALSGMPLDETGGWIVLVSCLAVGLAPQPGRELEDRARSLGMAFLPTRFDRQQVVVLSALVLVLIAVPLITREWIATTGEAAFHGGIVRELIRGAIPPDDPLLAGVPVRSFWAFHAYITVLVGVTQLSVPVLLLGGSLIAAFTLVFTGYRLLNLLGFAHAASLWGAVFLMFAFNAAAWLTAPWTGFGIVSPLPQFTDTATRFGYDLPHTFFLERFLRTGPLVLALAQLPVFLMASFATVGGGHRRQWGIYAFLAAAGLLTFHSGVAALVLVPAVLTVPVVWVSARLNPLRGLGREVTEGWLPIVLALLVTAPYTAALLPATRADGLAYIGLSDRFTPEMAIALAVPLLLGLWGVVRCLGSDEVPRQIWAIWTVLLVLVCAVVRFPGDTPRLVPLLIAQVPLSLTAGAWVGGWCSGRSWPVAVPTILVLLALLLPTTLVGLAGYLQAEDPRTAVRSEEGLDALVGWVRAHTPPETIVVDPSADLALSARRRLLYGGPAHVNAYGYGDHARGWRQICSAQLLRLEPLSDPQRNFLLGLDAPILIHVPSGIEIEDAPGSDYEIVHTRNGSLLVRWTPSWRSRP